MASAARRTSWRPDFYFSPVHHVLLACQPSIEFYHGLTSVLSSPTFDQQSYSRSTLTAMSKLLSRSKMASIPSTTKTWHKDTYSAINPVERSELSLKGKRVVISGGGAGIGKCLTRAFADAGASTIAILGRREGALQGTKQKIESSNERVTVSTHATDIVDIAAVSKAANEIGKWDVLVSNAGYLPDVKHLVESSPEDWWKGFEVFE